MTAAAVAIGGCAPPYSSRHWPRSREARPALVFDVDADLTQPDRFFDAPFPADARRLDNGAPDVRGVPNPFGVGFVEASRRVVMEDVVDNGVGFSPLPVVSFRFDRPLPPLRVLPLSTVREDAGVQLVDLTPGRIGQRVAVDVAVAAGDTVRPRGLLQLAPLTGLSLLPGTWAAIVRRDVDGDGVVDLDPSPTLAALLGGEHPDPAWRAAFAPLFAHLGALGIVPADVAAATVFTVGDPTATLFALLDEARHGPAPRLVRVEPARDVVADHPDFVEVRGVVAQPQHQEGEPPHLTGGGAFVRDAAGRLASTREEEATFHLSFPRGTMPEKGFPIVFYVHGTGGSPTQAIDRGPRERPGAPPVPGSGMASWLGPLGVGTACVAGPYSPDRIGWRALDGYGAYAFMNPRAMRNNFVQMLVEHARFLRLLEELRIDPALAPGVDASAAPDGRVRFDLSRAVVAGHSLGSYLSGMLAGNLDGWRGAVLSGAGGSWVEFAFGPKDPVDLQGLLETVALPPGEDLDRFHPFLDLFEAAVAAADNTFSTRHVLRAPRAGHEAPHVLVVEGQPDAQVPTNLQRALVRSIGADLIGDDVGARSVDRLLPALHAIGRAALPPPVAGNVVVDGVGARTAAVVRYAEDGRLDGHSVLFQRPDTRAVFVRFVKDTLDGAVPFVSP
ncbi:MAG: hypothetical protein FJ137_21560 [Deltaproteobacteria bacterium]|nr:hypothetical protein [Deltaproteobacteria bacterium]